MNRHAGRMRPSEKSFRVGLEPRSIKSVRTGLMSEPNCAHQWQVARNLAGRAMRVCRVCGLAELDPALKLHFTPERPLIPGWYWYRVNQKETKPVVVYVHPQLDKVDPREPETSQTANLTRGEWAGPLEMPDK